MPFATNEQEKEKENRNLTDRNQERRITSSDNLGAQHRKTNVTILADCGWEKGWNETKRGGAPWGFWTE